MSGDSRLRDESRHGIHGIQPTFLDHRMSVFCGSLRCLFYLKPTLKSQIWLKHTYTIHCSGDGDNFDPYPIEKSRRWFFALWRWWLIIEYHRVSSSIMKSFMGIPRWLKLFVSFHGWLISPYSTTWHPVTPRDSPMFCNGNPSGVVDPKS